MQSSRRSAVAAGVAAAEVEEEAGVAAAEVAAAEVGEEAAAGVAEAGVAVVVAVAVAAGLETETTETSCSCAAPGAGRSCCSSGRIVQAVLFPVAPALAWMYAAPAAPRP